HTRFSRDWSSDVCSSDLLFYPILSYFNILNGLLGYAYLILILQAIQSILSQFARAVGKIKTFAANGIIQTFVLGFSNIVLIVVRSEERRVGKEWKSRVDS